MSKSVADVMQLVKDEDVKFVDFRFTDTRGKEQHVSVPLSAFDEGIDLVLYFKHLMVLQGDPEYALHFNESDALSDSQKRFAETQLRLFKTWYAEWRGAKG